MSLHTYRFLILGDCEEGVGGVGFGLEAGAARYLTLAYNENRRFSLSLFGPDMGSGQGRGKLGLNRTRRPRKKVGQYLLRLGL